MSFFSNVRANLSSISEQSLAAPFPETRRPSHAAKSTLESIDSLESLALGSKSDISVRSGTSWRQAEQRWATTDVYLATVRTGNTVTVRIVEVRHTVGQSLAAVGGTRAGEPISTSPAVDLDDENHAPPEHIPAPAPAPDGGMRAGQSSPHDSPQMASKYVAGSRMVPMSSGGSLKPVQALKRTMTGDSVDVSVTRALESGDSDPHRSDADDEKDALYSLWGNIIDLAPIYVELYIEAYDQDFFVQTTAIYPAEAVRLGEDRKCYMARYDEEFSFDLACPVLRKRRSTQDSGSGRSHTGSGAGSIQTPHLCLMLFIGSDAVGELHLPIDQVRTATQWHHMTEVDRSFSGKMRRAHRNMPLTQRPSWFWEKKKGSRMARYSRKVVTMNVFFVLLVAVQIIIVVGAAAGMLYYAAYSQLFRLANVVAEQVEQGIIYELRNLFALPVAYCANTGGFFLHGVGPAEYDVVLHYLANNYISAMMENLMMPNQLFAASAEGYFYAFGLSEDFYAQYRHDRSKRPSMADFEISLVTDPQAPDALVLYGVNGDCEVDDYTCSMVNLTDRRSSQPFDATKRPWFQLAEGTVEVVWTPIYTYALGTLGISAGYRSPSDLQYPMKFVSATDISLDDLNILMESFQYFQTGYGFLVEQQTGYLLATSLGIPVFNPDGSRVLASESTSPAVSEITVLLPACPPGSGSVYCLASNYSLTGPHSEVVVLGTFGDVEHQQPWAVVVVVPKEDYTAGIDYMLLMSCLISAGLMTFAMLLTLLVSHGVTSQLSRSTRQMKELAMLNFNASNDNARGFNSPIKEISRIYEALNAMRVAMKSFSKYVPPEVVRLLLYGGEEAKRGGERRILTIFFSDVVDFTHITENVPMEKLIQVLREYLEEMSAIVQENMGLVDKYIGDSVMALWNAPNHIPDHAALACEAALVQQAALKVLRQDWGRRGLPPLYARMGINTGFATVGNFGSRDRLNYTALGDSVNLASRLEGLNKLFGTEIIISDNTYKLIKDRFLCRPLDAVCVKGTTIPVYVYELITDMVNATDRQKAQVDLFSEALSNYLARHFSKAHYLFTKYLDKYDPNDKAALAHMQQCSEYMKHPPPITWRGFRQLDEK